MRSEVLLIVKLEGRRSSEGGEKGMREREGGGGGGGGGG